MSLGLISIIGGFSLRQMSIAYGHRGWKRQPLGGLMRLGTFPSMVSRRGMSMLTLGMEFIRPWV